MSLNIDEPVKSRIAKQKNLHIQDVQRMTKRTRYMKTFYNTINIDSPVSGTGIYRYRKYHLWIKKQTAFTAYFEYVLHG